MPSFVLALDLTTTLGVILTATPHPFPSPQVPYNAFPSWTVLQREFCAHLRNLGQ